jgi:hypothetical protein
MPVDASEFLKGLGEARQQMLAAATHAVDVFAEQVIGDAQQLAPVKTGALQASGTTKPIEVEGETIHKEIGFNTDYAAAVHENTEAHHDMGQSKFLVTALQQNQSKLGPVVARAVKGAMG